jgi:hypothetical protein
MTKVMQLRILYIPVFMMWLVLASCQEDEPKITVGIVGKWAGEKVQIKVNPDGIIPAFNVPENELPVVLDFRNDGSLILTDKNSKTYNGTYQLNGDKLDIDIGYKFEYIDFTGQYDISELTETRLTASTTRSGTFDIPDYGQFDGSITATLFFTKAAN